MTDTLVADTSALISLAVADVLDPVLDRFDVHTTTLVRDELRETADYDDVHARGATAVLDRLDRLTVHEVDSPIESSRIDAGEGSCVVLARELGSAFLLTDDLRALPELEAAVDARVAISPIVLRALVIRGELTHEEALARLERLAEDRDWLGAPIYRRARELFDRK